MTTRAVRACTHTHPNTHSVNIVSQAWWLVAICFVFEHNFAMNINMRLDNCLILVYDHLFRNYKAVESKPLGVWYRTQVHIAALGSSKTISNACAHYMHCDSIKTGVLTVYFRLHRIFNDERSECSTLT